MVFYFNRIKRSIYFAVIESLLKHKIAGIALQADTSAFLHLLDVRIFGPLKYFFLQVLKVAAPEHA